MTTAEKLKAAQEIMTALEQAGRISVLNWMFVCDGELPDDEIAVYVAIEGADDPREAFHQDGGWVCNCSGCPLPSVYAWAHVPALPPIPQPIADEEGATS